MRLCQYTTFSVHLEQQRFWHIIACGTYLSLPLRFGVCAPRAPLSALVRGVHPMPSLSPLRRVCFSKKFHCGTCSVCGEYMTELSCMQLNISQSTKELHLHLTCCNNLAHVHCLKELKYPICQYIYKIELLTDGRP